jgi:hypothetical protein
MAMDIGPLLAPYVTLSSKVPHVSCPHAGEAAEPMTNAAIAVTARIVHLPADASCPPLVRSKTARKTHQGEAFSPV